MSDCKLAGCKKVTYPGLDIVIRRPPPCCCRTPPSTKSQFLRATLRSVCTRPILSVQQKESDFGQALQQQALQQKTPPQWSNSRDHRISRVQVRDRTHSSPDQAA